MKTGFEIVDRCNPTSCIASKTMKLNRVVNSIFRKHLNTIGITNSQLSILFVFSKVEKLNQKMLSDFLYMEKSTVNRNLKRLIENAYIEQTEFPFFSISEKGLELLCVAIPKWELAMQEARSKLKLSGEQGLNLAYSNIIQ